MKLALKAGLLAGLLIVAAIQPAFALSRTMGVRLMLISSAGAFIRQVMSPGDPLLVSVRGNRGTTVALFLPEHIPARASSANFVFTPAETHHTVTLQGNSATLTAPGKITASGNAGTRSGGGPALDRTQMTIIFQ